MIEIDEFIEMLRLEFGRPVFGTWREQTSALDSIDFDMIEVSFIFRKCLELCPAFAIPHSVRDGAQLSLLEIFHILAAQADRWRYSESFETDRCIADTLDGVSAPSTQGSLLDQA